jgi:type IV pilus assembly protein PilN
MAHINLLPWREERRQERLKQFAVGTGLSVAVTAILFYGAVLFVNGLIDEQNDRNNYLKSEIVALDKKIAEIKTLEQERDRLLARMQVIQELQESRPKVVKILDSLARVVPEGVHLQKVTRQGASLTFNGIAQSNARVSVFMREVDKNTEFDESDLKVIQRAAQTKSFTLTVNESKPKAEEGAQ